MNLTRTQVFPDTQPDYLLQITGIGKINVRIIYVHLTTPVNLVKEPGVLSLDTTPQQHHPRDLTPP